MSLFRVKLSHASGLLLWLHSLTMYLCLLHPPRGCSRDVSPAACELEEDPEAVLRACRVQEKLQERAILEEYLAQVTPDGQEQSLSSIRVIRLRSWDSMTIPLTLVSGTLGPSAPCAGGGQELQGLKEREDRLTQTVAQVEGVVDELSGFTERLQEVRPSLLTYTQWDHWEEAMEPHQRRGEGCPIALGVTEG